MKTTADITVEAVSQAEGFFVFLQRLLCSHHMAEHTAVYVAGCTVLIRLPDVICVLEEKKCWCTGPVQTDLHFFRLLVMWTFLLYSISIFWFRLSCGSSCVTFWRLQGWILLCRTLEKSLKYCWTMWCETEVIPKRSYIYGRSAMSSLAERSEQTRHCSFHNVRPCPW